MSTSERFFIVVTLIVIAMLVFRCDFLNRELQRQKAYSDLLEKSRDFYKKEAWHSLTNH